jgi:hypothetical protein
LWGREGAASERSLENTPKLPPIQLSGHPAIIFGKKSEQPQEKRNGTSEKKNSYKKFLAIGLSEHNPSLT